MMSDDQQWHCASKFYIKLSVQVVDIGLIPVPVRYLINFHWMPDLSFKASVSDLQIEVPDPKTEVPNLVAYPAGPAAEFNPWF